MLMQAIRDRAQTWISWVIVILIIIVMAAFGLNSYFESDPDATVAKVNGADIKYRRFQNAYENERSQMMQQLRGMDPALLESLGLKETVLNKLIDEEVLFQKTFNNGFAVGDAQLAGYINQIQIFQKDGRFDQETYEQLLSASRLTAAQWEQDQRRTLLLRQPENAVVSSSFVANKSIEQLIKFKDERRTFGYAIFPVENYIEDIIVNDEEIRTFYEANKDDYMHPERASVEYVELTVEELAKGVSVSEDAIQQRYEEQKTSFSVAERRRASHILVELDPEADEDAETAARSKVDEILAKLSQGEAFEELAKTYSDDPGSAAQGGDLGFFELGIMDKAFETAAFALNIDELSPVVQSAFGLHVIKLTDIEPAKIKSIEEVRESLEEGYRESIAESQFNDMAEQLDILAFEHPDTLRVIAEQLGLEVKISDYFSRDAGAGIAQHQKIRAAAFQPDVFESGNNSALIEINNRHVAVVRKKDSQARQHKTFDEVEEQLIAKLKRDKAAEAAKLAAQGVLAQVKEGKDFVELLDPLKLAWHAPEPIKREDPSLNRQLLDSVFSAKHPAPGQVEYGEAELNGGDYTIYVLTELIPGVADSMNEEELKSLQDREAFNRGRTEYVSLVGAWRSAADVVTYPDKLE